MINNSFTIRYL